MEGFKTWLEKSEVERGYDPDATTDHPARFQNAVSRHTPPDPNSPTVSKTMLGQDDNQDFEVGPGDLRVQLIKALSGVDPTLQERRKDGRSVERFSGTPKYTSPEQASRAFNAHMYYDKDNFEDLMHDVVKLYPDTKQTCEKLHELWHDFRQFLHNQNEWWWDKPKPKAKPVEPPHVVNFQVNIIRFKDCYKGFKEAQNIIKGYEQPEQYVDMIRAWKNFYAEWLRAAQGIIEKLVADDKKGRERQEQEVRAGRNK